MSRTVADIIHKNMILNPDDRYKTAVKMLYAFEHLHEADYRAKCSKRTIA